MTPLPAFEEGDLGPPRTAGSGPRTLRVTYLFTTFPLLSETPYQRELRALAGLPVELEIYSLWGGGRSFAGRPVRRFNKWRVFTLAWVLPYWLSKRPRVFADLAKRLLRGPLPSALNAGETLLGLAFSLCHAGRIARSRRRPDLIHAAWATLPATAAQLLQELTDIPFSMGGHAYDVFRDGGDWDLTRKLRKAALVVTSSQATRRGLLDRGAPPEKTVLVRRGFDVLPSWRAPRSNRDPLRILSVGRLVEKKGYPDQLATYADLRNAGLRFEARIVGSGPLRRSLERQIAQLALSDHVTLLRAQPQEAVFELYAWADVLLFTGRVADNGDRDGLPNVVPEAMACGVPVVSTPVAGVPEAIEHDRTGVLVPRQSEVTWLSALKALQSDDGFYLELSRAARAWVETHYDARKNSGRLLTRFRAAAASGGLALGPRRAPASPARAPRVEGS